MSVDVGQVADQGIERRRFIQGAATVMWATPLILTLTADRANAQQASCLPNGGQCDACTGLNCCDEDGDEDGGCCCSDANSPDCPGTCVAVDANCANMNTVGTDFTCFAPGPVISGFSARGSSKGPKG
jgi:hypothetical protein